MQNSNVIPEIGYLRLSSIIGKRATKNSPAIAAIIPVSRSTWWTGVKNGRYPKPVRTLGDRITAWRVEDIRAFIESTCILPETDKTRAHARGRADKGGVF